MLGGSSGSSGSNTEWNISRWEGTEIRAGDLKLHCLPSDRKIQLTVDGPQSSSSEWDYLHLNDGKKNMIPLHRNRRTKPPTKDPKFDPRPYEILLRQNSLKNPCLSSQILLDTEKHRTSEENVIGLEEKNPEEKELHIGLSIISKYPVGVHLQVLEHEMKKWNLLAGKFLEKYPGLFQIVRTRLDQPLVFLRTPMEMESIREVEEKLFHYLRVILALEPTHRIPFQDFPTRLQNIFGIRFSPPTWGYEEPKDFFCDFIRVYDYFEEIHYSPSPIPSIYLKEEEEVVSDDLEEEDARIFPREYYGQGLKWHYLPSYYSDFIRGRVVNIPRVDEGIHLLKQYLVMGEYLVSPEHFYVSLWQYRWEREAFTNTMTKFYEGWSRDQLVKERIMTTPDQLEIGGYVALKWGRKGEDEKDKEWHRAEIIRRDKTNHFDVFLVDKAIFVIGVPVERLKALHRTFADFPIQSFACTLTQTSALHHAIQGGRNSLAMRMFWNLLKEKVFAVTPIERLCRDKLVVQALVIDNVENLNILIPNLAKNLIRYHRKDTFVLDKENREKKNSAI